MSGDLKNLKEKKVLINTYPHKIFIFSEQDAVFDEKTRKLILKDGAKFLAVIPPSGKFLIAKTEQISSKPIDGIPIKEQKFTAIDDPWKIFNVPYQETSDTYFIVSAMFISALEAEKKSAQNLLTVGGVVYDSPTAPKPIGCTFLIEN